ncbi:uncharacterized protein [Porites lutea]|uniref:uncharacterized protein n=1 Tax=Porites lutea TaxID=51062 RepID=UPI003CC66CEB
MAAASDPEEILRSTRGKDNFKRITRLLISGGTSLLREIFDSICPPSNLPTILSNPVTKNQLKAAKLTMPQWHSLCPSPGMYGKSADFDVTLLFRLLRTICSLTPPTTGWDALPVSTDHSLTADIARVKYYRNSVYGHVNQGMEIRDNEFKTLWQEISEALVRIAGQISSTRKIAWQGAIAKYLTDPLTTEDERNVQELEAWYKSDMEIKKSIEEVRERINRLEVGLKTAVQEESKSITALHERTDLIKVAVRQEAKEIKDQLIEMNRQSLNRNSPSRSADQTSRALLPLKIDCEAFSGTGPQREATVMVEAPLEDQGKIEERAVVPATLSPSQTSNVTASQTIPSSQDILNLIASKYLNNLNPSTPEDFNGFVRYMKEVREVILVDCKPGSLIITVECGSLKILEELWQDYCTRNLSRVVQQYLVTEDILKELGLTEVKLTTTIDEEDYRACLKHFKRGLKQSKIAI